MGAVFGLMFWVFALLVYSIYDAIKPGYYAHSSRAFSWSSSPSNSDRSPDPPSRPYYKNLDYVVGKVIDSVWAEIADRDRLVRFFDDWSEHRAEWGDRLNWDRVNEYFPTTGLMTKYGEYFIAWPNERVLKDMLNIPTLPCDGKSIGVQFSRFLDTYERASEYMNGQFIIDSQNIDATYKKRIEDVRQYVIPYCIYRKGKRRHSEIVPDFDRDAILKYAHTLYYKRLNKPYQTRERDLFPVIFDNIPEEQWQKYYRCACCIREEPENPEGGCTQK